ncbi:serine/threonine-protein kinase [Pseudomonas sp. DWP3-1-2]|uniref:serine/threonine-protein kinase n=1 Tax=Pseudomonas sp. DWP3-1-2 TaxID=2804645 RepID=UPI003CE6EB76
MIEPVSSEDAKVKVGQLTCFAMEGGLGVETSSSEPCKMSVGELPKILCGRYQLQGLLGAGGMAVVYRAKDLVHEQYGEPAPYLAVKLLNEEFADAPDADVLLYSEFALTRHLRHPNVIRVHAFEVEPGCQRAFITQELNCGSTLDKLLCEQPGGLYADQLQAIAVPLLDALAYVHERGVLHGDLKPGNLMLTDDGPRMFDFGLGVALDGVMDGLPRLSRDRFKAWTPDYAAPELLEGAPLSMQSDVYAMGCVLYELASGKHPFPNISSVQARADRLWFRLRPPANLPIRFWPALRLALALDVGVRTITARELRDAFSTVPIGRMQF